MTTEIPEPVGLPGRAERFDVVIVGFGMAGACAAIAACEAGADVLVIERGGAAGGTSALSAGHFYLGGGTPVQVATGHHDSVEEMAAYLKAVLPHPDIRKIDQYCQDSVAHFGWLEAHGIEFERSYYAGKAVYQPGTEGLMYTGNEKVWPYRCQARPAPRGHKVAIPQEGGGAHVMQVLAEQVCAIGIEVRFETAASALAAEDGRVRGVAWRGVDGAEGVVAAGAVVLASGGYVMNPAMLEHYTPKLSTRFAPLGTPFDDGFGIRMGQSVGGAVEHMDGAFLTASFYPPAQLLNGIIVNAMGQRFVAEDSYHGRTASAVLSQPDAKAYLVVDERTMAWPELPLVRFVDGFASIDEAERALGIPEGNLAATLEQYNAHAADGDDLVLHKHPDWLTPLDRGPWGVFDLTPGAATYVGFTLGGLRTSVDAQVLREDATAVDGLYAAGACASNIAQDGSGYASGTCLGEASYFGRRAGEHAAGANRR